MNVAPTAGRLLMPTQPVAIIPELLSLAEADALACDYRKNSNDYNQLFRLAPHRPLNESAFPLQNKDIPDALQTLVTRLSAVVVPCTPKPIHLSLARIIDGLSGSKPHTDLVVPSYTFITVVEGSMACEYGGKLKDKKIIGGTHGHLPTGYGLFINNTSRFTSRREPHATSGAKGCLRFVMSYGVDRRYLT